MTECCSLGRYVHGQEAIDRRLKFLTMNAAWPPIYPDPDDLDIFGVVTHIIHRPREMY